jgi:Fur family peroxide stress response transcriptional regulator
MIHFSNPKLSKEAQARSQVMLTALRRAHLRLTPQRIAICNFLAETRSHPTINEIFEAILVQHPTISRATVYNTMTTLKELGEIIELPSAAGASVRYETDLRPHVNLTCTQCGNIYDVPVDDLQALMQKINNSTDFLVQSVAVSGTGLCARCQQKAG